MNYNKNEIKPLYHGTNLKEAKSILDQLLFKGEKFLPHHEQGYVSFSTNILWASHFGEIVFEFPYGIPEAIEVPYEDKEWFYSNRELTEYIFITEFEKIDFERSLQNAWIEEESYIPNKFSFSLQDITLHFIRPKTVYSIDEVKEELGHLKDIIDSRHLLEEIDKKAKVFSLENGEMVEVKR